jgi:four helix bundle protein
MKTFSFEKLLVWQKAKELTLEVYHITNNFPTEEKFGLTSQLRRASISVSSNIAEGSSRKTPKDQNRFYVIAYSSGIEILNQLIISEALGYLNEKKLKESRKKLSEILAMLDALSKSLNL